MCTKIGRKSIVLLRITIFGNIIKGLGHGVVLSGKYIDYSFAHLKHEKLFATIPIDNIAAQVAENMVRDKKKK